MLVISLAFLLGSTLQSSLGFGFALVASPMLLLVLEPAQALTLLLSLGPALNVLVLVGERRRWHVRGRLVGMLLAGALPGLVVGVVALRLAGRPALQVAVGVAVLLAVAGQLLPVRAGRGGGAPRWWAGAAVGAVTGALTTSTGTNGPPMVLWLQHLRLPPPQVRDTLFVAFTALGFLGLATLVLSGSWDIGPVGVGGIVVLAALTLLGRAVGWVLFRRLPAAGFRVGGLVVVSALGCASLVAGLG